MNVVAENPYVELISSLRKRRERQLAALEDTDRQLGGAIEASGAWEEKHRAGQADLKLARK